MKKFLKLTLIISFALLLGACGKKAPQEEAKTTQRIINQLEINQRPFVALFPHPTGKLLTLMIDKPGDIPEAKLEIEYLSGNSLKGGRATVEFPTDLPYTRSFLLGTCSAGGSCSFDEDLSTGTVKTNFTLGDNLHVLKDTFVFIDGETSTSDLRLKFDPQSPLTGIQILAFTHGYLGQTDLEVTQPGVLITSSNSRDIAGQLSIKAPQAQKLYYYNGQEYQEIEAQKEGQYLVADIDLSPQSNQIEIIRDDLQGETEEVTLYQVGPFIAVK